MTTKNFGFWVCLFGFFINILLLPVTDNPITLVTCAFFLVGGIANELK